MSKLLFALVGAAALLGAAGLQAADDFERSAPLDRSLPKPEVRQLRGIRADGFGRDTRMIGSEEELVQALGKEEAARVLGEVDFAREKILWLTWAGSSSSYLTYRVEQDGIKLKVVVAIETSNPALTDFRPRGALLVMPKNASWQYGRVGDDRDGLAPLS